MRLQLRRGITSLWTSRNPILAAGEPGFDTTTGDLRIGDGVTAWSGLTSYRRVTNNTFTGYVIFSAGGESDGDLYIFVGDLIVGTVGKGLRVKEGVGAKLGVATLVGGTVTVPNVNVTASSRIFLTAQTSGAAPGTLRVSTLTAGVSFVITSTSPTDTSQVAWMIVEPSP